MGSALDIGHHKCPMSRPTPGILLAGGLVVPYQLDKGAQSDPSITSTEFGG